MAMTREQSIAMARARRRRAEAEQATANPQGSVLSPLVQGLTFGFADEIAGVARAPIAAYRDGIGLGEAYGQERQRSLAMLDDARRDSPVLSTVAEVGGSLALPLGAARAGMTLMRGGGSLGSTIGRGAAEGAGYGALYGAGSAEESRAEGLGQGAVFGALAGGAAPAIIAGGARLAQPIYDAARQSFGPIASQAANRVNSSIRATGATPTDVRSQIAALGPDAMIADVMGMRGQALARSAANVSPDARQTLEAASYGRLSGQNDRVVGEINRAAGLAPNSRATVDDLKATIRQRTQPAISEAYDEAARAGYDLPREPFRHLFEAPMFRSAYEAAGESLRNRAAFQGSDAASELNRLNQTKISLDSIAEMARRSGDRDTFAQASGLASNLREVIDQTTVGPEYSRARDLARQAFQSTDAIDAGAELSRPNVAFEAPRVAEQAAQVGRGTGSQREVAQGYAAEIAEQLLNRRNTPGAIDRFQTPMARQAMTAALGAGADDVAAALSREQTFNQTHRALTGNSTTARQLAEMGMTAGAGAGLGFMGGLDVQQAGMVGIAAALARRGGGAAIAKLRSGNEEAVAQEVARLLIAQGVPTSPRGVTQALSTLEGTQNVARLLSASGGGQAGSIAAQ